MCWHTASLVISGTIEVIHDVITLLSSPIKGSDSHNTFFTPIHNKKRGGGKKKYFSKNLLQMEDPSSLKMEKQMLLTELNAIEQKISLFTTATTVTVVPEGENLKTKARPVQTAPGKDSTKKRYKYLRLEGRPIDHPTGPLGPWGRSPQVLLKTHRVHPF